MYLTLEQGQDYFVPLEWSYCNDTLFNGTDQRNAIGKLTVKITEI